MSRFDSAEHLYDWQRSGRFPRIHDDIYNLIRSEVSPSDGPVLDLGSSTGLLARRLQHARFAVHAVEADANSIDAGRTAGTYGPNVPVRHWMLTPGQMPEFGEFLANAGITIVVARRVLPELDDAGVTPELLGETLANAGVSHLFLEGRAPRQDAKHRLRSVSDEVAGLETDWRPATFAGNHRAYLTLKE
ncbi:class I SAM-dependent methyltransferase [Nocardia panacis]|uniref:Class I SAM-dependent methyltransferase n=1 Tax=Nocardia panacis TaxID=2340916 RepID=A0A3A4K5Q4_9NOCA|nr:class I SAM-dependent methyltransferase [Nocardia panacis]RJO69790.1 class I SAM-dependent methyltransferase [Nocardia panacis]